MTMGGVCLSFAAGAALLSLLVIAAVPTRGQLASELDATLLQQMLDELTLRDETTRSLQTARAGSEQELPFGDEHTVDDSDADPDENEAGLLEREEEAAAEQRDLMQRARKESQISVYNYVPSIRDQEYLEHSSLWGHQYMAGGAGEGPQRLRPDGSARTVQVVKSDAMLPAYCNPPNPCPSGYSGEDGCLEKFENTAAFSRSYQQEQYCMCDSEHMFDCPGATKDDQVNKLARQIGNEALVDDALDRIAYHLDGTAANAGATGNVMANSKHIRVEGEHKSLVAKKFFTKKAHFKADGRDSDSLRTQPRTNLQQQQQQQRQQLAPQHTQAAGSVDDVVGSLKSLAAPLPVGPVDRTHRLRRAVAGRRNENEAVAAKPVVASANASVDGAAASTNRKPQVPTRIILNPYLQGERLPVVAKKG